MHSRNERYGLGRLWMIAFGVWLVPLVSFAMEPLYPADVERLQKAGLLEAHYDFVRTMKNYEVRPDLLARKMDQLRAYRPGAKVLPQAFPNWFPVGLPSHGKVNIFALLIEFPNSSSDPGVDYTHTLDRSYFDNCLFGNGDASEFPYESLRSYYLRSSYGVLEINGTALGWYKAKNARDTYGTDAGVKALIKEALDNLTTVHDFSVYDNDGDGTIDYFIVVYTGTVTGGFPWWAWDDLQGNYFKGDPYTVDGKKLGVFTWMWEKNPAYPATTAQVSIHETGHALGLPDYYDYDPTTGPPGGVGGMDIMDANWGDHNCFSKWLLDWITPTVVAANGSQTATLRAGASFGDAVLVMPGFDPANPFTEFFMVQNRMQTGNDAPLPNSGLLIWHVDATLQAPPNPADFWAPFAFNNSTTSHKLLRLMEADGRDDIERTGVADTGDFYELGNSFAPDSQPNSNDYQDSPTGIIVDNISTSGPIMKATVTITGNYGYGLRVIALGTEHVYGTVTPLTGKYTAGSIVSLEASPEYGYRVKKWTNTDNDASVANINTVTMSKSTTVYVEFEQIPDIYHAITATVVGGHGVLWPLDLTYLEGSTIVVACEPDPGYQVKQWTGTDDDNLKTNTNTVTMTDNMTISVEFEPIPAMGSEQAGMGAPDLTKTTVATDETAANSNIPGFGTLINSCVPLSIVILAGLALGAAAMTRIKE